MNSIFLVSSEKDNIRTQQVIEASSARLATMQFIRNSNLFRLGNLATITTQEVNPRTTRIFKVSSSFQIWEQ